MVIREQRASEELNNQHFAQEGEKESISENQATF